MTDMLKIEDVVLDYPSNYGKGVLRAIDHVNFSVPRGQFIAVLGHNGSGKSTLARMLNGLLVPTEGRILVDGMDTRDENLIWDIRKKAGMVFQNPDNQIVATIVEEDVAFGAENLGIPMPELRDRVEWALKMVEMEDYAMHVPHLLSGGQKQRVAIAGILAMNPDCIILDEPTAMLDPVGRKEVMETINRLHKEQNKTIVIITHYMDEAVQAERVVVLEDGKMLNDGTPKEVFSQVERMKAYGLDVPQVTELVYRLRKRGYDLPGDILTVKELVDALC
ncbi:MAG: energy-coupling factor transporter ATPase [Tissierellia bacterium]|nr:energy-coupling factor transporter ATPase [Tissierellia bacterium]